MTEDPDHGLPDELRIALSHTPARWRPALTTFLHFDGLLARIAGQTNEVMLGQMRLAWWRDMLRTPPASRPRGDAVLDGIGLHWHGREGALSELVDAWEVLIVADAMEREDILAFGQGRAAPFAALAADPAKAQSARTAGLRWALAEAAPRLSEGAERERFVAVGLDHRGPGGRLPRALKGLAVLDALSTRALERGGRPLMEGRGAAIAAMRAAILGR